MNDPAYAVQVGQAAALLAAPAVTAIVDQRVVDPMSAPAEGFPLIEIGDDQILGDDNTCGSLSEVISTLHLWADGPDGRHKVKQLADAVRDALSVPFALTGFVMRTALFESSRFFLEADSTNPDALLAHGVMVFRFRVQPLP